MAKYTTVFLLCLSYLSILFSGCSSTGGELVGVKSRTLKVQEVPYGMVYIPGGTFMMGQGTGEERRVTISSFYMDETEISNSEYRQFVNWVRDSIAITNYLQDDNYFLPEDPASGLRFIDWEKVHSGKSFWESDDPVVRERLGGMYYQGEDRIFGRNEVDVSQLKYHFEVFDLRAAAANKGKNLPRSTFIFRDTVAIYPDTLSWISDFAYAQNEPMAQGYFSHPAFDNYPVVGITWRQARAFNVWRTRLYDHYVKSVRSGKIAERLSYQLPTEAQWEYAARGGKEGNPFPWEGDSVRNARGCLMANFKPDEGDYAQDQGIYTLPVDSYYPNDFGLYNMAGNVAEWTSTAYVEFPNVFLHDMNPTYDYDAKPEDAEVQKRKVVRGGSWKDISYFIQNSSRAFEYQDSAKSYIGFRSVTPFLGSDRR